MEEISCSICIEKFNKMPSKKQAKCPYCNIKVCVKCTQTYLIGSHEDPHCMGCRKGWSREVLDSFALITWIDGEYKKHREDILVDRERSRLPAAQLIIERIKEAEERRPILTELRAEELRIHKMHRDISEKLREEETRVNLLSRGLLPDSETATTERRIFVMPCPVSSCRGFLSSAYKCGVCDTYACSDCREIKGVSKDSPHTCDPKTVETVLALKKECKNCPECGTTIFKISGCAQMFCTQCHTSFDWSSGKKIISGPIHNPHYFDYIRQLNGGQMPRQPGDIPCGNNLPSAWHLDRLLRRITGATSVETKRMFVYTALLGFHHMSGWEIPNLTNRAEDTNNTDYNVKYLRNEINEAKWKQALQQREKRRMRRDEIRQRMEAFCGAANDIYWKFATSMKSRTDLPKQCLTKDIVDLDEIYTTLMQLRTMMNTEFMKLSYRYRCQIIWFNEDMSYTKKRAPRQKEADSSEEGV